MESIVVDESRFPMLVVTFNGTATNAEFERYLEQMTRARSRGPGVAILDALNAGQTSAQQRKLQAEWMKAQKPMLERNSLGTAFVINSAFVRGLLTAILWLAPIPGPHTVVATFEEAEAWTIGKLRAAGLSAPARLRRSA